MNAAFSVYPPVALRGSRDYVHSTDLYSGLVAALESNGVASPCEFELKIRDRIVVRPRYDFYLGDSAPVGHKPLAVAKFKNANQTWTAHVAAGSDPAVSRKPYDESGIWSKVQQNASSFEVRDCHGYTPIEVVTAVAVLAHQTMYPPATGSRWLLAQISGRRMLAATENAYFRLDIARTIGPKMVQSNMCDSLGVFVTMLFFLG